MTVARQKQFFRAGDQIDVDTINRAEESCNEDNRRSLDRRYFHSFYTCDLDGMDSSDSNNAPRSYIIDVDLEHTITGFDVQVSSAVADTLTVTIESLTGTSFTTETLDVTTTASASSPSYATKNVSINVAADARYRVKIEGAVTISHGTINVYYVADRQTCNSQSEITEATTPQNLKSGDTMTAASFSAQDTALAAAVTAEAARCYAPMITVVRFEDPQSFPVHIPASQKCLWTAYHALVAAVTRTITVTIDDENAVQIGTHALTGAGTGSTALGAIASGGDDTQSIHDPEDHNDAWELDVAISGSGTPLHYYVVLVFI